MMDYEREEIPNPSKRKEEKFHFRHGEMKFPRDFWMKMFGK